MVGMKKLLFTLALCLIAVACSDKPATVKSEQLAGHAAVQYYGYLLRGDFTAFVDGLDYPNPMPKDYRALQEKNAAMFVHEQDSLRGGIKKVNLSKADIMPADSSAAAVYLLLTFGNNTSEEVLVPMVRRNGKWLMK